ncbi:hypothetical protein CH296_00305 [Rhodococcus sp. 14-2496-1d]|nr:hypothetical protein CH296_00305 [Rhodococcus sp. 14-2496-1d]
MLRRLIEIVLLGTILFTIERTRRSVMAVGTETRAALAEVSAAIAAETDQAADKIIEALGADAETAAEVRKLLAPIKGIVPDAATDDAEAGTDGEAAEIETGTGTEPGDVTPEGGIVPGEALPR